MDSLTGGSKRPLQTDIQPLPHRHRHLEPLDRPTKRRRSISPLNDKLSRSKRTTLIHHHLHQTTTTTLTKAKKDNNIVNQSPKFTPTINAAVDRINERATRLGLENTYPEDVEMDFCPHSDAEEAEDEQTNYERVPMHQSTHTLTSALLPLHKPHPIAYQQHLALISSSRSKKLSNSSRHLNSQKQSNDREDEQESNL